MMTNQNRHAEAGNAFFMVMVGIVLFAGLMFTFSRGAQQGGTRLTEKQIEIAASDLIANAQKYRRTVDRLRMRGCSENQISFASAGSGMLTLQDDSDLSYTNANSPTDGSCHIFNPNGGNISPYRIAEDYAVNNDSVPAADSHSRSIHFTDIRVQDVERDGTNGSDLVMWHGRIQKNICTEINDQLGITNPGGNPPEDDWACVNDGAPYTGSFATCADAIGDDEAALTGQEVFCVRTENNDYSYLFMNVLIPR